MIKLTKYLFYNQGETETKVMEYAATHPGVVEATCVRPSYIVSPTKPLPDPALGEKFGTIDVSVFSLAMLDQVVHGFEKDPLLNEDLNRIGETAFKQA